jgi:hypothetical protein
MRTIISSLIVVLLFFVNIPLSSARGSGTIPKQFWGVWLPPKECKEFKKIEIRPEDIVEVKSNKVIGYEHGCDLIKIKQSSTNKFSGDFSCSGEGETWKSEVVLTLNAGKLSDGTKHGLVPCD